MDENIRNLIFQAIDQTISAPDFERLQDAIEQREEVRVEYLTAVGLCESLSDIAGQDNSDDDKPKRRRGRASLPYAAGQLAFVLSWGWRLPAALAIAATILVLVGGTAFWFGQRNVFLQPRQVAGNEEPAAEAAESLIAGHATLRRSVDLHWSDAGPSYREGDVLPAGMLQFDEGVAEIDFFCGATLMVEGPAKMELESDWSVRFLRGRLRANVPPPARGFVVYAAGSQIVDLGTEFALEVAADSARVEVLDGEVKLLGGDHDGNHLVTGQGRWLRGTEGAPGDASLVALSTSGDVRRRSEAAERQRFGKWKATSQDLRRDERLIAYYPIAEAQAGRFVPNAAATGRQLDGALVGLVDRVRGRFGSPSTGLEFDRTGARVRVRIDGQFQAFTFACWAKLDDLQHRYNALFMGDGYENGEPHWQIQADGRLMFSVMVDDTQETRHFDKTDRRMVTTPGLHHVYFTEPFWDISKSGQWFHLAAVYDPMRRRVVQYVNGQQISSEQILDKYFIKHLRIGPAEIGNWGQPFRNSPWFAVRNLNGTIDELAIFNAALTPEEIQHLYEQGKPLGY